MFYQLFSIPESTAVTTNGAMTIKGIKCPKQTSTASVCLSLQDNLTNKIGNNSPIEVSVTVVRLFMTQLIAIVVCTQSSNSSYNLNLFNKVDFLI